MLPPAFHRIRPWWLILAFAALLLLPALVFGPGGYDLRCVGLRSQGFSAQFWRGTLYPRWLEAVYSGYGSPVFFYYPPLSYFAAALFSPLFKPDAFGFYPIAASALLATFIAGLTFYRWMAQEGCLQGAAVLGSLLYMAAPQDLGYNFYYWMLFSSVWGYAWLPWLFASARRIARGEAFGVAGFAVSLCLLILSNVPMTVMFAPMAVAYAAYGMWRARADGWTRRAGRGALAIVLGFGLAAVYLLPMALYMDYVHVERHWDLPETDYHHYFLRLGFASSSQAIYTSAWLVLAGLTLVYAWALRKAGGALFFALASLAALFMVLNLSAPLWALIPVIKIVQFPERLFIVPALCLAVLASFAPARLRLLTCAVVLFFACLVARMADWDMLMSPEILQKKPLAYAEYQLKVDQYTHFLPNFAPFETLYGRFYSLAGLKDVEADTQKITVLQGDAKADIDHWRARDILLHYTATQPSTLKIRQFYFPGFVAKVNGEAVPLQYDDKTGAIIMSVPGGQGVVSLQLEALPPEVIGRMLSLLSAAVVALLFLTGVRRKVEEGMLSERSPGPGYTGGP